MAQRLKPIDSTDTNDYNNYVKKLTLLHKMLVSSMMAKQTTDLSHIKRLRALLAEFQDAYLAKSTNEH